MVLNSLKNVMRQLTRVVFTLLVPVFMVMALSQSAYAADVTGTAGSPNTIAAATAVTTTADDKFAFISAAAGVNGGAFNIDHNTTIYVADGDDGSHALTLLGIDVAEDKTLTFIMNQNSSTGSADANQLTVLQSVAVTGGGSLVFDFGTCGATACAVVPVLNLGNGTGDTMAVKDFTINGMDSAAGGVTTSTVGGTNGAITATGDRKSVV